MLVGRTQPSVAVEGYAGDRASVARPAGEFDFDVEQRIGIPHDAT
jgi:hypothetical protein